MNARTWLRVVELSSPLWIVLAVWASRKDVSVAFGWENLLNSSSAWWVLMPTAVAWYAVWIWLRPLTAERVSPRRRFCLLAALVTAWAFAFHLLVRFWQYDPDVNTNRLLSFIPGALLVWGVRERLSDAMPVCNENTCTACGYSRSGLPGKSVCPECGSAG